MSAPSQWFYILNCIIHLKGNVKSLYKEQENSNMAKSYMYIWIFFL